jgi:hypothetical protein
MSNERMQAVMKELQRRIENNLTEKTEKLNRLIGPQ